MAKLKLGTTSDIPATYRNYTVNETATFTENGEYTPSLEYDGFSLVKAEVPIGTESTTITTNGTYTPTAPNVAFDEATINVTYIPVSETTTIIQNGTYTPSQDKECFSQVTVNVPAGLKTKIGTNINNYLGDLDENGKLLLPSVDININAVGVTDLADNALYCKYYANPNVKTVSFSDLTTISGSSGMRQAFYNCTGLTSIDLPSLTTVSGILAMYYAFQNCTGLTSLDLSNLTTISGSQCMYGSFQNCTGLTSLDLSSLTTVSGSQCMIGAFYNCTSLTSVDLSSLTTISGGSDMQQVFYGCTGLISVDLSSLTTISSSQSMSNAFFGCTGLTSIDLSNLTTISGSQSMYYTFYNCSSLKALSFPRLKDFGTQYINQFQSMLQNCTGITLHFRYDMESKIKSLTGYSDTKPFGATSGTVLFDLSKANLEFNVTSDSPISIYIDGELQS